MTIGNDRLMENVDNAIALQ